MRRLLTLFDINPSEFNGLLKLASELKSKMLAGNRPALFPGYVQGLLFEKQSLRTRVSFESAMAHLGGSSIYLGSDAGWGKRETIADFGRVLSQYVDVLVFRGHGHKDLEELAEHCQCPVINGLTDFSHPCQALADLLTFQETAGPLAGGKLTFVGDGNNVARSLAVACALAGTEMMLACPPGYELPDEFVSRVKKQHPDFKLGQTNDAQAAVEGANAVYTDVWASMGQEGEKEKRLRDFAEFQVNAELMRHASDTACFMHCLPAHRGEEVTDEVIDSPASVVVQQAANRMHAQKAVLVWLLQGGRVQVPGVG
jgi:ornithine carbamoyltransferase